mgnify:CR=1 FL=1
MECHQLQYSHTQLPRPPTTLFIPLLYPPRVSLIASVVTARFALSSFVIIVVSATGRPRTTATEERRRHTGADPIATTATAAAAATATLTTCCCSFWQLGLRWRLLRLLLPQMQLWAQQRAWRRQGTLTRTR